MATMVCRGLQPCVDAQFIESPWPRLSSPHTKFNASQLPPSFQFAFNSCFPDQPLHHCDGLNQILLNYNATAAASPLPLPPSDSDSDHAAVPAITKSVMAINESDEIAVPYVHPLVKRSRSALSDDSLALCTENLGNETGAADFVDDDDLFSDLKIERSAIRKRVKSNRGNTKLFPPPLTTISGGDSIRVLSYREDGRLIMEAVKAPTRLMYFHVERSHGRLRLSILKSSAPKIDSVEESTENERDEVEVEEKRMQNDDVGVVGRESKYEEDVGGKVEGNRNFGGAEVEIQKFERPCRCNNEAGENYNIDENKQNTEMLLLTREPLSIWVSTS